ncbi:diacylglycerol kinase family protein [Streptomyces sp. NPDC049970]|uniref:diacylglycerol kinase family protein n=1 Tax=Streptomyces sp. NPDC049970 TaxID=3155033 RepID=UPI00341B3332
MPTDIPERRAALTDASVSTVPPVPADRTVVTRPVSGGRGAAVGPRQAPKTAGGTGRAAGIIASMAVCQAALMVGFGLLITGPAADVWPLTSEDGVTDGLERARTGTLDTVSLVVSEAGNTATVVIGTLVSCLVLLLVPRLPRWRDAIFLAVGVSLQSLVFLAITESVDRNRPDVERLDASPPTSSFTSGHTGAATALYAGLAVLVLHRVKGPWRKVLAALLLLVPLLVGLARMYRGMHHPTDVAGGILNGGLSLLIVGRALLTGPHVPAPAPAAEATLPRPATVWGQDPGRTVVVHNPTVTGEETLTALRRVLDEHGHAGADFVPTTADDPGEGQVAEAIRQGATLVVVCGGDGTVRAAAEALAGTDVPLVVVPCGTGNLLARNLGLPVKPAQALTAALGGAPHRVDLGLVEGDGLAPAHFTAMSGAGLDAAMLESTSDRAKAVLGWPAYVMAGLRELRAPRMRLTVSVDGARPVRRSARMVLVANTGKVQGGAALVPAARPDDGVLDLMILDPRGPAGWLSAVGSLLRPRPDAKAAPEDGPLTAGSHRSVEYFTFRSADIRFDAPQPRELDGDPVSPGRQLTVRVRPGALTVLMPVRGE